MIIVDDAATTRLVHDEAADLIVTSPPYNVGMAYDGEAASDQVSHASYLEFTRAWMKNCLRWTRPTGRMCVNVALDSSKGGKFPLAAAVTRCGLEVGWKYHATIIWNEGNISKRTAWGSWKSASAPHVISPAEVIIVFYKDAWKRATRGTSDITADEFKAWVLGCWTFPGESAKRIGHEAPFPRELPRRCIKLFSYVGDTVLDPFLGSGTTMIEAYDNDRYGIGIEKEQKYVDLAQRRIMKELGDKHPMWGAAQRLLCR